MLECSKLLEFNVKLSPKHDAAHGLRINVLMISQLLSDVTFSKRSDYNL